ncbi:MAG: glucosaminidase domain-containing protein [Polaribacter sp.]
MKLKGFLVGFCLLLLASCGSKKQAVRKKQSPGVVLSEPKPVNLPSVKENKHVKKLVKKDKRLSKKTLKYIENYAAIAVREMHIHKIPASITLAQGILESGSGNGNLAKRSNNHFGIKCHSKWKGERVYHDDDEAQECFRKYQYVATSYNDHSAFLTKRKRYAFLFNYSTKDYKRWARGLKKAGYATDKKYPNKLISIIERYKLYEFDKIKKKDFKFSKNRKDDKVESEKPNTKTKSYSVVKGDTLYSISRKFGISVATLKKLNRLKNNTLSIGQKLLVK